MKTLIVFSLFLLVGWNSFAAGPKFVVKTESYFGVEGGSKLEGSGIVFIMNKKYYVLTSEHVILPSNDKAVHFVSNRIAYRVKAEFVDSSWDKGLALLSISDTETAKKLFSDAPTFEDLKQPAASGAIGIKGFPVGADDLVEKGDGSVIQQLGAGQFLFSQPVVLVGGFLAEFGMSGGPAFSSDRFFGIVSHVGMDLKTLIIPAADALNWVQNRPAPVFQRTIDDFRKLYFCSSKAEQVLHVPSGMLFVKRDSPYSSILYMFKGKSPTGYFSNVLQTMKDFDVGSMSVEGAGGRPLPRNGSLAELLYFIFSDRSKPIDFIDGDMESDFGPQCSYHQVERGHA